MYHALIPADAVAFIAHQRFISNKQTKQEFLDYFTGFGIRPMASASASARTSTTSKQGWKVEVYVPVCAYVYVGEKLQRMRNR